MKLRNSSYNTSAVKVEEERSNMSTCEDSSSRNGVHNDVSSVRLRRYKTYPSDYVSEFSSLSLGGANSIMPKNFKSESEFDSISYFGSDDRASSIDTISIYSESVCDVSDDDDMYSDVTYQSSINRPVKKRKFANFSDVHSEYGEDVRSEYSFKSNYYPDSDREEMLDSDPIILNNTNYGAKFRKLVKLLILIFLFLIFISIVLLVTMSACVSQNKQTIPLENIKGNLSKCLIGHDHSVPIILDAIDKFNIHYLEKKIYFISIVGPVGIGKSYAKQLIRNSLGSSVVSYSVLSSLLPLDVISMERVIDNLVHNLDVCKPNVIFVDGFDENNDVTFTFLEGLFNHLNIHKTGLSSSVHLKVLVIACGTQGSSYINRSYAKHLRESSRGRISLNFDKLRKEVYKESPFSNKSKLSLHVTVVPFLPLEVEHLQECIVHQLNYIYKNALCDSVADNTLKLYLKDNNFTLKEIEDEVLKLSSVHKASKILHTGCKRVYQLVSSLLFQLPNN